MDRMPVAWRTNSSRAIAPTKRKKITQKPQPDLRSIYAAAPVCISLPSSSSSSSSCFSSSYSFFSYTVWQSVCVSICMQMDTR